MIRSRYQGMQDTLERLEGAVKKAERVNLVVRQRAPKMSPDTRGGNNPRDWDTSNAHSEAVGLPSEARQGDIPNALTPPGTAHTDNNAAHGICSMLLQGRIFSESPTHSSLLPPAKLFRSPSYFNDDFDDDSRLKTSTCGPPAKPLAASKPSPRRTEDPSHYLTNVSSSIDSATCGHCPAGSNVATACLSRPTDVACVPTFSFRSTAARCQQVQGLRHRFEENDNDSVEQKDAMAGCPFSTDPPRPLSTDLAPPYVVPFVTAVGRPSAVALHREDHQSFPPPCPPPVDAVPQPIPYPPEDACGLPVPVPSDMTPRPNSDSAVTAPANLSPSCRHPASHRMGLSVAPATSGGSSSGAPSCRSKLRPCQLMPVQLGSGPQSPRRRCRSFLASEGEGIGKNLPVVAEMASRCVLPRPAPYSVTQSIVSEAVSASSVCVSSSPGLQTCPSTTRVSRRSVVTPAASDLGDVPSGQSIRQSRSAQLTKSFRAAAATRLAASSASALKPATLEPHLVSSVPAKPPNLGHPSASPAAPLRAQAAASSDPKINSRAVAESPGFAKLSSRRQPAVPPSAGVSPPSVLPPATADPKDLDRRIQELAISLNVK
eukprot:GHVT01094014.1.p1 GENE.GHVT01094014.1~~GHVT01094014.1.p1  ORF type:complete len:601 (-),score=62.38 GHVT01094014.1:136-1938(-)